MATNSNKTSISITKFPVQHNLSFAQITPEKFRKAYKQAQNGSPGALFALMEFFLDMDGVLAGLLTQRKNAILTEAPVVVPADDSAEAEKQADGLREALNELGIRDLVDEMANDAYYGISLQHIKWELIDKQWVPLGFEPMPLDGVTSKKQSEERQLKDLILYNKYRLSSYPDGVILTSLFKRISTLHVPLNFTNMGRGLPSLRFAMAKYYNYEDWMALNEIFAIPFLVGKYAPGASNADIERLENQVYNAGNSSRMVVDEQSSIEIKDAPVTSGAETFEKLKNSANDEMAISMLSQAGTTTDNKVGSFAAKKTLNGVRIETALADKHRHEKNLNQLSRIYSALNYSKPLPPKIVLDVTPADDLESEMRILDIATKMVDVPKSHVYDRFSIPRPKDDEEIVSRETGLLGGI
jgi:phage gp29-like protein